MNTVQEPLTPVPPPPCFVQNSAEPNRADLPTNSSRESPAANVYQQDELRGVDKDHQELSRVNKGRPETSPNQLPDRCQFTFSDGRQCRMQRSEIHPRLCRFHKEREEEELFGSQPSYDTLAALGLLELEATSRDLTTCTGIHRALAQVFRLLAQRRISRQEAVAFGYLAQLMLQTVHPVRMDVPSEQREARDLSAPPVTQVAGPIRMVGPSSDESLPAANVYQQDELRAEKKDQEPVLGGRLNKAEPRPGGFLMSAEPECSPSSIFCWPTMPVVSEERFVLSGCSRARPRSPEDQHLQMQKSPPQLTQNEHVQNLKT